MQINAKRGFWQEDVISPKLLTLVLEHILKKLQWENKYLNLHGKLLLNLRITENIVLFAKDKHTYVRMYQMRLQKWDNT